MRFVYLDESGIGNKNEEPFVVVAGVIVHADDQLRSVEQFLNGMIDRHVHPLLRKFTCFHAKELFNGGKIFDREAYSKEARWHILQELCAIPSKFNLPIVVGVVPRAAYASAPWRKEWEQKNLVAGAQMLASVICSIAVEKYLRENGEGEVAALVYENNDAAKERIRLSQRLLKDGDFTDLLGDDFMSKKFRDYLPLSKIAESPLFSEKNESSLLQVADAVAWAINRKLRNAPECDRFFCLMDKQIAIVRPKAFGPVPVSADKESFL